jgi:nucleotide-binding universal stress UspA family protein
MTQRGPVVCATDLSTTGAEAVELGARVASATGRQLHVVHVTGVGPEIFEGEPISEADRVYRERLEERLEAAEKGLEEACATAAALGPKAQSVLLRGRPWEELVDYAQRCQASLLCVGSHGHGGARKAQRREVTEWILGSTADRVLRHAPCPVLVGARREVHTAPLHGGTWLAAVDFSDQSEAAAKLAYELATACAAKLVVLHVITDPLAQLDPTGAGEPFPPMPGLHATARKQRSAELAAFVERELAGAAEIRVEIGEPCYEITAVAVELNARVVAMGTHGRKGLARLLLGSTAERTLRRSTAPVLCVRT